MTMEQGTKLDKLFNNTLTMLLQVMDPNFCITHKCMGEKDHETLKRVD
jgi:hypothetical protein